MGVVAEVDAPEEGALFADGEQFLLFGCAGEEDRCIMSEDTCEDLQALLSKRKTQSFGLFIP